MMMLMMMLEWAYMLQKHKHLVITCCSSVPPADRKAFDMTPASLKSAVSDAIELTNTSAYSTQCKTVTVNSLPSL